MSSRFRAAAAPCPSARALGLLYPGHALIAVSRRGFAGRSRRRAARRGLLSPAVARANVMKVIANVEATLCNDHWRRPAPAAAASAAFNIGMAQQEHPVPHASRAPPAVARTTGARPDYTRAFRIPRSSARRLASAQAADFPHRPSRRSPLLSRLPAAIRCVCGRNLDDGFMIQCTSPQCGIWQHAKCACQPSLPAPPFLCEGCRIARADPFFRTTQALVGSAKVTDRHSRAERNRESPARGAFHVAVACGLHVHSFAIGACNPWQPQRAPSVVAAGSPPSQPPHHAARVPPPQLMARDGSWEGKDKSMRRCFHLPPHVMQRLAGEKDRVKLHVACVMLGDAHRDRYHWPLNCQLVVNGRHYR